MAFTLLACSDIRAQKVNLELPFATPPRSLVDLRSVLEHTFRDEEAALKRAAGVSDVRACEPFTVSRIQRYEDDTQTWADVHSVDQLQTYDQLYVFRKNSTRADISSQRELPPPRRSVYFAAYATVSDGDRDGERRRAALLLLRSRETLRPPRTHSRESAASARQHRHDAASSAHSRSASPSQRRLHASARSPARQGQYVDATVSGSALHQHNMGNTSSSTLYNNNSNNNGAMSVGAMAASGLHSSATSPSKATTAAAAAVASYIRELTTPQQIEYLFAVCDDGRSGLISLGAFEELFRRCDIRFPSDVTHDLFRHFAKRTQHESVMTYDDFRAYAAAFPVTVNVAYQRLSNQDKSDALRQAQADNASVVSSLQREVAELETRLAQARRALARAEQKATRLQDDLDELARQQDAAYAREEQAVLDKEVSVFRYRERLAREERDYERLALERRRRTTQLGLDSVSLQTSGDDGDRYGPKALLLRRRVMYARLPSLLLHRHDVTTTVYKPEQHRVCDGPPPRRQHDESEATAAQQQQQDTWREYASRRSWSEQSCTLAARTQRERGAVQLFRPTPPRALAALTQRALVQRRLCGNADAMTLPCVSPSRRNDDDDNDDDRHIATRAQRWLVYEERYERDLIAAAAQRTSPLLCYACDVDARSNSSSSSVQQTRAVIVQRTLSSSSSSLRLLTSLLRFDAGDTHARVCAALQRSSSNDNRSHMLPSPSSDSSSSDSSSSHAHTAVVATRTANDDDDDDDSSRRCNAMWRAACRDKQTMWQRACALHDVLQRQCRLVVDEWTQRVALVAQFASCAYPQPCRCLRLDMEVLAMSGVALEPALPLPCVLVALALSQHDVTAARLCAQRQCTLAAWRDELQLRCACTRARDALVADEARLRDTLAGYAAYVTTLHTQTPRDRRDRCAYSCTYAAYTARCRLADVCDAVRQRCVVDAEATARRALCDAYATTMRVRRRQCVRRVTAMHDAARAAMQRDEAAAWQALLQQHLYACELQQQQPQKRRRHVMLAVDANDAAAAVVTLSSTHDDDDDNSSSSKDGAAVVTALHVAPQQQQLGSDAHDAHTRSRRCNACSSDTNDASRACVACWLVESAMQALVRAEARQRDALVRHAADARAALLQCGEARLLHAFAAAYDAVRRDEAHAWSLLTRLVAPEQAARAALQQRCDDERARLLGCRATATSRSAAAVAASHGSDMTRLHRDVVADLATFLTIDDVLCFF